MGFVNIEIKARCNNPDFVRKYLKGQGASFIGTDHQRDTYFNVPNGRLKLREGNIENNLIFYQRSNESGPKQSDFILTPVTDASNLKESLSLSLGVKVIVEKQREIYFIDNVKFHIDAITQVGIFVEIEAGNKTQPLSLIQLREQCDKYMEALGIKEHDLIQTSYSDMLLQ